MASFTGTHRYAYHVFPLQALKPIREDKALFSKANDKRKVSLKRNTSAAVDAALGFEDFVHFYLPKGEAIHFSKLSILGAQLNESEDRAFPHIALVVDTANLEDRDCTVCNFNIAVSRLSYTGVKGGNHARGKSAEKIKSHWRGFREENPELQRRRYSQWVEGFEVPILTGSEITRNPQWVGFGTKVAELLIRGQYNLHEADRFYCFSRYDLQSVAMMPGHPRVDLALSHSHSLGWYSEQDRVAPEDRKSIEQYFADPNAVFPSELDCHRIRRTRKVTDGENPAAS